jgi:hypothetical protein
MCFFEFGDQVLAVGEVAQWFPGGILTGVVIPQNEELVLAVAVTVLKDLFDCELLMAMHHYGSWTLWSSLAE